MSFCEDTFKMRPGTIITVLTLAASVLIWIVSFKTHASDVEEFLKQDREEMIQRIRDIEEREKRNSDTLSTLAGQMDMLVRFIHNEQKE